MKVQLYLQQFRKQKEDLSDNWSQLYPKTRNINGGADGSNQFEGLPMPYIGMVCFAKCNHGKYHFAIWIVEFVSLFSKDICFVKQ